METKVLSNIQTHDAFRKTWSEPATIISEDDLREAERRDNTDGDQCASNALKTQVINKSNPALPNIRIHSDDTETQKSCESHEMTFKTPQKLQPDCTKRLCTLNSDMLKNSHHSILCDQSDWMLAERSNSRSPPSPAQVSMSPDLRSRSPMVPRSPSMRTNTNIFNFSPERTEMFKEMEAETRRAKKRLFDEISYASDVSGSCATSGHYSAHHSPTHRHRDVYMSPRPMTSRHYAIHEENEPEIPQSMRSPAFRDLNSPLYEPDVLTAKRRLDVDCEYTEISSPKRLQTDLVRKVGFRYLQQLESDITAIRNKLHKPEPEVKKSSNCTCAIMEREFLEMAESAYRSVRRNDASPRGFEQFRRELIQTNEVMKDSMEVLKNIRSFCEHKC